MKMADLDGENQRFAAFIKSKNILYLPLFVAESASAIKGESNQNELSKGKGLIL